MNQITPHLFHNNTRINMRRNILLLSFLILNSTLLVAQNVTLQAEFEKNEGLMLKWNYSENIDSTVARIAALISADDKVWLLYDPANSVTLESIQSQLTSYGANIPNIIFTEGIAETPWLRDFGPIAGYNQNENGYLRHFVDSQYNPALYPMADFIPLILASGLNFNYEAMPINFEGGNLSLDGIGRGFVSDRVLTENPGMNTSQIIQTLYTKLSLNEIIILPSIPDCGGGNWSELSRLVKFTDPETVLVSEFPQSTPYYQQIEMIADTLSRTYNDVGKLLRVVRLPVAPGANGEFATSGSDEIRSYTSSILFNEKILIPSYNDPYDEVALEIYKEIFHGYQVYQIPSQAISALQGSLYRLAVNIPQEKFFRIRHSKYTLQQPYESELWINTFVQSPDPIDSIQLFYRIHPSTSWEVMNTYGCCGGNSGFLSGYNINDTISYYLQAYGGDHIQTLPLGAPQSSFTFWFDLFTGKPNYTEENKIQVYPNPANSYVNIRGMYLKNEAATFQILNSNGSCIHSGEMKNSEKILLPTDLANGFYMIKITTTGKTHFCKLYLQR